MWLKRVLCRHTEIERISPVRVKCRNCGKEFWLLAPDEPKEKEEEDHGGDDRTRGHR